MKRKMIRSFLLLLLALAMLTGCGAGARADGAESAPEKTAAASAPAPADTEDDAAPEDSRVMVVVFSGTGHTRRIAQVLAEGLGTELAEIVPAEPYTEEDLNYNDSATRATREQNDPDARPEIAEPIEGLEDCAVLFLGYPIWWGQEPRILDTFLETYDLSGVRVIPFCTSGSSGIDTSVRQLSALAEDAEWMEGRRFETDASEEEITNWAAEMLAPENDQED